jgi:transposase
MITIFLSKQLNDENDITKISIRKLARKYEEEKGIKKSKSTIHYYLKKKMGYKYLKSTIKTKEVLQENNILISLAFIKIISRSIRFDLNIIYCDESYICSNNNNNIKVWRKSFEEIYENIAKKQKINLILSVYEEGVLYYELNDTNTKSSTFIEYLKNLLKAIKAKNINHYAIVLDNYRAHKTNEAFKFYYDNKINIIFNSPYASKFSSVELSFRNLKRHLYTRCFLDMNQTITEVKSVLDSENFQKSIKKNYKQTLEEYLVFNKKRNNM